MARFSRGFDQSYAPDDAPQAQRSRTYAPRANQYGGRCRQCNGWVESGEGLLVGSRTEGWAVEHEDCTAVEAVERAPRERATMVGAFAVVDGKYTIQRIDNADDYITIRVRTQDEDDTFMPGRQVLGYLSGANNDADYTQFAHVDERGAVRIWKAHRDNARLAQAVQVLAGDPKACAVAFGRKTETCWRCGRTLSTPESIERGMGEQCAEMGGF